MSTTADRIFSLLKKKGIEQKEFARLIGTSDKTVSAWKMGRAKSYTKYLSQIAEILETTVDYLVNGNSDILITRHDLPPQGSLTELLDAGESAIRAKQKEGRGMKLPYRLPEDDETVTALAEQILQVILASGCTFRKADDALTVAQNMLLERTRPVIETATP